MKIDPSSFTLLDGPLLPNDAIEDAKALKLDAPDDLAISADGALLVCDGNAIRRIGKNMKRVKPFVQFGGKVTALCSLADGRIAASVEGEGLYAVSVPDGDARLVSDDSNLQSAITACAVTADGALVVTRATTTNGRYPFTHELFAQNGSGQLLKVGTDGNCEILAQGLRGPHGVALTPAGDIAIAETWAAAIRMLRPGGKLETVISSFAGYPGRLFSMTEGGFLLACLSRRDPLVDFVRTEAEFAERMMRELDPAHWVAPRLESNIDVNVPMQSGATRLFGEIKPWAPSLSYGLVCEMDDSFVPRAGYHSRANGVRHGIVSAVEWNGGIAAVSKATGEVVFMQPKARNHDG